jgi:hypothetical protein
MRISVFVALVLSLFAIESVSQDTTLSQNATISQNTTLTLDDVDSQVSDFLQLIQNGSISTRGTSAKSSLPSGCALAVSSRPEASSPSQY